MGGFLHTEPAVPRWSPIASGAEMTENWPAAGADDWMDLVRRSLRGRDLAELSSTTRDGIEIWPLYTDGPERPAPLAVTTRSHITLAARSTAMVTNWSAVAASRNPINAAAESTGTPASTSARR